MKTNYFNSFTSYKTKLKINKLSKKSKEYNFYEFYFSKFAKDIPIENFFFYLTNKHKNKKQQFRSKFSVELFQRWKLSHEFIRDITNTITKDFLNEFKIFNQNKILIMFNKWNKQIKKLGKKEAMILIINSFFTKGCKLPWTLLEVQSAIKSTLEKLTY